MSYTHQTRVRFGPPLTPVVKTLLILNIAVYLGQTFDRSLHFYWLDLWMSLIPVTVTLGGEQLRVGPFDRIAGGRGRAGKFRRDSMMSRRGDRSNRRRPGAEAATRAVEDRVGVEVAVVPGRADEAHQLVRLDVVADEVAGTQFGALATLAADVFRDLDGIVQRPGALQDGRVVGGRAIRAAVVLVTGASRSVSAPMSTPPPGSGRRAPSRRPPRRPARGTACRWPPRR